MFYRTRFTLIPLAVAVVLAYCGLGLLKTAILLDGTPADAAGGIFLILVGAWMVFAILRRGVIR